MTMRMFAFLRAINTGGRRLTNERLLEPFRAAGLHDVAAYQAAGNISFRSDRDLAAIEADLTSLLPAAYGFEAPVFVRTAEELGSRLAGVPFTEEELAATEGRTQITFLAAPPDPTQVDAAMDLVPAADRVVFVGREWFWLPTAGISTSSLPVGRIEDVVGPMTMRTVGTVERMLARFTD